LIDELGIQIRFRSVFEVTSAINSGYCKNGATPGANSIVGTVIDLLGCAGTVEELAEPITLSVDGSLLAVGILESLSWSVKCRSVLIHIQNSSSFSEFQ